MCFSGCSFSHCKMFAVDKRTMCCFTMGAASPTTITDRWTKKSKKSIRLSLFLAFMQYVKKCVLAKSKHTPRSLFYICLKCSNVYSVHLSDQFKSLFSMHSATCLIFLSFQWCILQLIWHQFYLFFALSLHASMETFQKRIVFIDNFTSRFFLVVTKWEMVPLKLSPCELIR